MSISFSLKIDLYVFFLDGRLDESVVVDLSSRSLNGLSSSGSLILRFSGNNLSGFFSLRGSVEVNGFVVVNNLSIMNWLSVVFFSRNGDFSGGRVIFGHGSSSYRIVVNSSWLSSLNINLLSDGFNGRLNKSLSYGKLSRNVYINIFSFGLVINDSILGDSLSVYRSLYNFSSFYRSLYDSLSNDRLRSDGSSNDRLRNDLSGNYRSRFDSLCLCDNWLGVVSGLSQLGFSLKFSSEFSGQG